MKNDAWYAEGPGFDPPWDYQSFDLDEIIFDLLTGGCVLILSQPLQGLCLKSGNLSGHSFLFLKRHIATLQLMWRWYRDTNDERYMECYQKCTCYLKMCRYSACDFTPTRSVLWGLSWPIKSLEVLIVDYADVGERINKGAESLAKETKEDGDWKS